MSPSEDVVWSQSITAAWAAGSGKGWGAPHRGTSKPARGGKENGRRKKCGRRRVCNLEKKSAGTFSSIQFDNHPLYAR